MLSRHILAKGFKPTLQRTRTLATVVQGATGKSTPRPIKDRATFTIRVCLHHPLPDML
jgi:hypothetical protein